MQRVYRSLFVVAAMGSGLGCSTSSQSKGEASTNGTQNGPVLSIGDGSSVSSSYVPDTDPGSEGCANQTFAGERVTAPVDVPITERVLVPSAFYIMLDRSLSMVEDDLASLFGAVRTGAAPAGAASQKWQNAVEGLNAFVNDPQSAGISMGLHYFPRGGTCDGAGYDQPTVPLAPLPGNAASIVNSLAAQLPNGFTPLEGALRGVTNFCVEFNATHPEERCVAVLITDGAPTECGARRSADLAAIAEAAARRGVITFAAGMQGANFQILDAIAEAGGGDCDPAAPGWACDLTTSADAFGDALERIRENVRTQTRVQTLPGNPLEALSCAWSLPEAPAGSRLDFSQVEVELSDAGDSSWRLIHVESEAACTSDAGGWFFDNPAEPSVVRACASTCAELGALPNARIDLHVGCSSVIR